MKTNTYNPDVLNCLANLSNDEVFTPPSLANQVLDLLPKEVFTSPETTFLDPVSKSGVFLREIVKRLDRGLEPLMPNRRERIEHILKKQVFGIAITELTSHLSRRSVYCSKDASSEYSVIRFATESGNILYSPLHHTWQNGKNVESWLFTIAYNLCRNTWRHQQIEAGFRSNVTTDEYAMPSIEVDLDRDALDSALHEVLESLDDENRLLFSLRYEEEQTVPQIAVIIGIPEGTVKSRLHKLINIINGKAQL